MYEIYIFMLNKIKIELAKKAVGRGSSGLYFVDDILGNTTAIIDYLDCYCVFRMGGAYDY